MLRGIDDNRTTRIDNGEPDDRHGTGYIDGDRASGDFASRPRRPIFAATCAPLDRFRRAPGEVRGGWRHGSDMFPTPLDCQCVAPSFYAGSRFHSTLIA